MKDNRQKMIHLIVWLLPFAGLFVLSKLFLSHVYWFEWTARHYYLFLWGIVILFVLWDKPVIAALLSLGNLLGILIGQFLGDGIRAINISRIKPDMSAEKVSRMYHHPAFEIWLITIGICLLIGILIHLSFSKSLNKRRGGPWPIGVEPIIGSTIGASIFSVLFVIIKRAGAGGFILGLALGFAAGLAIMVYRMRKRNVQRQ